MCKSNSRCSRTKPNHPNIASPADESVPSDPQRPTFSASSSFEQSISNTSSAQYASTSSYKLSSGTSFSSRTSLSSLRESLPETPSAMLVLQISLSNATETGRCSKVRVTIYKSAESAHAPYFTWCKHSNVRDCSFTNMLGNEEKRGDQTERECRRTKKSHKQLSPSRVVGQGGYGIVYKGILPTNRDRIPLLVYEFINNGSLLHHIHKNDGQEKSPISWELRLKIATETAGAVAYLHYATSTPIIHRNVKTGNILLDEKFTPKVSDFGASRSRIHAFEPAHRKSDVNSFGVVLAELLTGKKVLCFDRPENERNLATLFVSSMEEDRLFQIVDGDIVNEENVETLKYVANLAIRCLRIRSEERPKMKEVAMELEGLRALEMHQWGKVDMCSQDTELLTRQSSNPYAIDYGGPCDSSAGILSTSTVGYDDSR
ncbi:hypothetical protein FNV43_RR06347 [Rhamnella rubrinervis]|uniref:Protein kinase domain-containing protein n=1 Tax=Rhamnella rubrinervis TaxID=2594499 RepID=A0A8K0HCV9_9ROSA|nr:hypothetical protein FNV43_RR06347 [Rhamnella rubrinervis]